MSTLNKVLLIGGLFHRKEIEVAECMTICIPEKHDEYTFMHYYNKFNYDTYIHNKTSCVLNENIKLNDMVVFIPDEKLQHDDTHKENIIHATDCPCSKCSGGEVIYHSPLCQCPNCLPSENK